MERIDLNTWTRRDLFENYRETDLPYIIITARVDVTRLLEHTKRRDLPFSFALAYLCTRTANGIPNFRYRFDEDGPFLIKYNHAMITHLRPGDDTFTMLEGTLADDMESFCTALKKRADDPDYHYSVKDLPARVDYINYSSLPWVDYTHIFRPIAHLGQDCLPKITWGKYTPDSDGTFSLNLSLQVHHGLMDGCHVGLFYEKLQAEIDGLMP